MSKIEKQRDIRVRDNLYNWAIKGPLSLVDSIG